METPTANQDRFIQHHYDGPTHQFETGKLGMWFFLVQEILFFSALFVAYIVYRSNHPEIFAYAHAYLNVNLGAINTAVLLVSSLTAAWAVRAAQLGQQRTLITMLLLTIVCAMGFLVIKYVEYRHKFHEGLVYGAKFDPCIAASGRPLLNKSNHCPGTKSSVIYNQAEHKAATGCIDGDLDKDPNSPGIQPSCSVTERVVTFKRADGATQKFEQSSRKLPACTETRGETPCWMLAANPAVCPPSPDGAPSHAVLVRYGDHLMRGPKVQIDAACSKVLPAPASGDPYAQPPSAELARNMSGRLATPTDAHAGLAATDSATGASPALTAHERARAFFDAPPPPRTNMFFTIYFAMTGLHGIHVIVGIGIFVWLLLRAMAGHFGPRYFGPIDYAALYWHLVDLIWIFLFPLMYLIH